MQYWVVLYCVVVSWHDRLLVRSWYIDTSIVWAKVNFVRMDVWCSYERNIVLLSTMYLTLDIFCLVGLPQFWHNVSLITEYTSCPRISWISNLQIHCLKKPINPERQFPINFLLCHVQCMRPGCPHDLLWSFVLYSSCDFLHMDLHLSQLNL